MKKFLLVFLGFSMCFIVEGQQDAHFTQWQWNQLAFNPAYAGSRDALSLQFLGRTQWVDLDGQPQTGTISLHSPVGNRVGLGLFGFVDKLGIEQKSGLTLSYAYRLELPKGRLSLGLNAGFELYNADLTSTFLGDPSDPSFSQNVENVFNPNFGAGIYYYSDRFWIGGSVPHLLDNELNDVAGNTSNFAEQRRHYTASAGYVMPLGPNVKFRPSAITKYVDGSPLQFDIDAALKFYDKLWLGASYRTGDSYDFHLEYLVNNALTLGYAYDLTDTDLRPFNNGTHEILVSFDFNFQERKIVTPRNMKRDF